MVDSQGFAAYSIWSTPHHGADYGLLATLLLPLHRIRTMTCRGFDLFIEAEQLYRQGRFADALEFYRLSVKRILKDGDINYPMPVTVSVDLPVEVLGCVWANFVGFFRDAEMSFTQGVYEWVVVGGSLV